MRRKKYQQVRKIQKICSRKSYSLINNLIISNIGLKTRLKIKSLAFFSALASAIGIGILAMLLFNV